MTKLKLEKKGFKERRLYTEDLNKVLKPHLRSLCDALLSCFTHKETRKTNSLNITKLEADMHNEEIMLLQNS